MKRSLYLKSCYETPDTASSQSGGVLRPRNKVESLLEGYAIYGPFNLSMNRFEPTSFKLHKMVELSHEFVVLDEYVVSRSFE